MSSSSLSVYELSFNNRGTSPINLLLIALYILFYESIINGKFSFNRLEDQRGKVNVWLLLLHLNVALPSFNVFYNNNF